jgi:phosphoglycolate phosphatase
MKFESLILDIDGTLWDSRALVAEGWNERLRQEGYGHLCVTAEGLTPLFGKTKKELADIMFTSLPEAERIPLMERCMDREQRYLVENPCQVGYPGVKETLEELSKTHRLFIVSNCEKGYPEICMEKLGLTHLFSGHLCFGDTRTCKGETILRLMKDHAITSACYIGDTQGDADASKMANLPFIYCTFGFGQVDGFWKEINQFQELLDIL